MRLVDRYDAIVCDLDGVVYRGDPAVPHAVESLSAAGIPVQYATNNASRPPAAVGEHLRRLGLDVEDSAVATSSQAAAWLLQRDGLAQGTLVLAVGGAGVADALSEAGYVPVRRSAETDDEVLAVVQGYGPDVTASDLAEAAYVAGGGGRWVATNTDATLPTDRGTAPGNGSLVAAVARAVGREPDLVAGKPQPPLYLLAADRLGVPADRVLAVGDRLDTDIEGAVRAGTDSLLVLTGVDDLDAVLEAPVTRRPTVIAPDLRWLHDDPASGAPSVEDLAAAVAAVHAALDSGATGELEALRERARGLLREMSAR